MRAAPTGLADWEAFVIRYGSRALTEHLAAVVGQPPAAIERLRATGACSRLEKGKGFGELFSLWHGREPVEADWPSPRRRVAGIYEWQPPELALLASLVGQIAQDEIAEVLTARLRERTGDPTAERTQTAVQVATNRIGLQSTDVVGGLTTARAASEIGSLAIINQMITKGQLRTRRVGRLHVIPYVVWEEWKASRTFPPAGYVQLSTLRGPLGIRSDSKLSEFAKGGLIPTAVRCNPYGSGGRSTQFGTWWVSRETADVLVADRRAGRPMPWQGKFLDNLRKSFALWQERQHPARCETCAGIWGEAGPPGTFEQYLARYPALANGAKRHLTRPWSPGLTPEEVAAQAGRPVEVVRLAIANDALAATTENGRQYVSRTDATRWIAARKCPTGESKRSWISLEHAAEAYLFTVRELRALVSTGQLSARVGIDGAARGKTYLLRQQCSQLRDRLGFSEEEAARRLGITVAHLRHVLDTVDWRQAERIPLVTLQAVRKRLNSRRGHTLEEAAAAVRKPASWVQDRIDDGTIRLARVKWDPRRTYITEPMLQRLHVAACCAQASQPLSESWLKLSQAAAEAGVSPATLNAWGVKGELRYKDVAGTRHYHRAAVRARARKYWQSVRFRRATPPDWFRGEENADGRAKGAVGCEEGHA